MSRASRPRGEWAPRPPRRGERDLEGRRQRDVSGASREDEVCSSGWKRLREAPAMAVAREIQEGAGRSERFHGSSNGRRSNCPVMVRLARFRRRRAPRVRGGIRRRIGQSGGSILGRSGCRRRAGSGRDVLHFGCCRVQLRGDLLLDHRHAVEDKLEGGVVLSLVQSVAISASGRFGDCGFRRGRGGVRKLV